MFLDMMQSLISESAVPSDRIQIPGPSLVATYRGIGTLLPADQHWGNAGSDVCMCKHRQHNRDRRVKGLTLESASHIEDSVDCVSLRIVCLCIRSDALLPISLQRRELAACYQQFTSTRSNIR